MTKLLHLEDSPEDAELVAHLLKVEAPEIQITLVSTRKDFLRELGQPNFDVILSDYNLPGLGAPEALALAREKKPNTPFIVISGTIGEDSAVQLIRQGAVDFLLKDRIQRLPVAIRRAIQDRDERLKHESDEELIHEQAELLDRIRDGIAVTDLAHTIVYWNVTAERILGWTAEEALGQNALKLFGRGLETSVRAMERYLESDEEWRGELSVTGKSGKVLLIELRVTMVHDLNGQPKSHLAIIEDITERKKLEEKFLRSQRLESFGLLATGIAHDLNNTLAPMLMASEILRTRVTEPADAKLLDLLAVSGERSAALVKQIVSFGKGGGREKVLIQTRHLLLNILNLMQETFPKSIRLENDIPTGLWTVQGNPEQLQQALVNFCINARDAMPDGGVLRLTARNHAVTENEAKAIRGCAPGRYLVLEVSDTGRGIPAYVLEHIWQAFYSPSGEGKGSGIGLSTARGIAVNHGGYVHASSEVGRGSTFGIYLPAGEAEPTTSAPNSLAPFLGRSHGELVLVVDDEEGIRESVSVILRRTGYRPISTPGGIEALAQYAGRIQEVALVITDLDMPGLGGAAFANAVRHLNPATKILFISGAPDASGIPLASLGPGTGFLPKPFSSEALLLKVEQLLQLRPGQ
ncbi:MAG TPA: response regulator [Opitutaceae bacterium]|nr:response regulator [Opitutaceae bacterium]